MNFILEATLQLEPGNRPSNVGRVSGGLPQNEPEHMHMGLHGPATSNQWQFSLSYSL